MDYIQNAANYSGNRGADAYNSLQQQTPDQLRAALPYLLAGGAGGALGGLGGYLGSGEDEEGNSNAGRNALLMGLGGAGLGAGGLAGYNYLQNNPEVANRIRSQAGDLGTQFNQAVIDPLKQYFR